MTTRSLFVIASEQGAVLGHTEVAGMHYVRDVVRARIKRGEHPEFPPEQLTPREAARWGFARYLVESGRLNEGPPEGGEPVARG